MLLGGCSVPAEYASFPVIKTIFSRTCNDDDNAQHTTQQLSSFAIEMTEMAYILENANNQSLVIIDELGRGSPLTFSPLRLISKLVGTCTEDATALSRAICEALIKENQVILY